MEFNCHRCHNPKCNRMAGDKPYCDACMRAYEMGYNKGLAKKGDKNWYPYCVVCANKELCEEQSKPGGCIDGDGFELAPIKKNN